VASVAADTPRPLAAISVNECNKSVALFIFLDSTHMLRADPRQSDMFTVSPNGTTKQTSAPPMKWEDAFALAQSAAITSHVMLPCRETGI
jgi:hypothetical protein